MLRKLTDLQGYAIRATDDFIGTVSDFYFDDEDWGVRYAPSGPHEGPSGA